MITKKVLITGVSSGIGKSLTKRLVNNGFIVWGIARREKLLKQLRKELDRDHFRYSVCDISSYQSWVKLVRRLKSAKFLPQVVILNAAILENDFGNTLKLESTRKMMETNFFGVLFSVEQLLSIVKPTAQFIAISSLSAFKGNSSEGIGYAASKAAVSVAFESLHQRYKSRGPIFKLVYFGPIDSGMGTFKKHSMLVISEKEAVDGITKAIENNQAIYYYPWHLFMIMKLIKLMPSSIYFKTLSFLESIRQRMVKN